ncbi:uncharacterized protein LOC128681127 [Plodia interpunctella]|uniref:uncharacterized protein LOC128681127 n=1 Tax=Plodia interpunctella TaxID=58824 RepID=UPI00236749E3|nr:uncharacterized protein LOC128681127 [Plodia interpunctella]
MNAYAVFFLCSVVGNTFGYYAPREAPYNTGPNDPYSVAVDPNFLQQPSQRLFWGNGQGSNQVGGTGLWATLTNKFPFLGSMFGRMELPSQYGVPNQYELATQYGAPPRVQPQFYQAPPVYQQHPQQFAQGFVPFGRDVGLTDDAVIITPPQVPINPQPAPAPAPVPEPQPGYQYNKPQYRLDLPHK